MSPTADVVLGRKSRFKANAASMKIFTTAIGGGDYQTIINQPGTISSWAPKIPNDFSKCDGWNDTVTRAKILINFGDFTVLPKAYPTVANRLVIAAKSWSPGAMMAHLKELGTS